MYPSVKCVGQYVMEEYGVRSREYRSSAKSQWHDNDRDIRYLKVGTFDDARSGQRQCAGYYRGT